LNLITIVVLSFVNGFAIYAIKGDSKITALYYTSLTTSLSIAIYLVVSYLSAGLTELFNIGVRSIT